MYIYIYPPTFDSKPLALHQLIQDAHDAGAEKPADPTALSAQRHLEGASVHQLSVDPQVAGIFTNGPTKFTENSSVEMIYMFKFLLKHLKPTID